MKLAVYAIFDKKSIMYKTPFLAHNDDVAIRMFSSAVNGERSELSDFPEDFDLYKLASFDDESGTYCNEPSPVIITNGAPLKMAQQLPEQIHTELGVNEDGNDQE